MSNDTSYQELLDKAKAGYPESWIPKKKGDTLAGIFTGLDKGNSAFGPTPIALLTDESGKNWSIWLFHTALLNQFKQAAPQPGAKVVVVYGGEVLVKDPKPGRAKAYHSYRVVTDNAGTDISWDAIADDGSLSEPVAVEAATEDDIPFEG